MFVREALESKAIAGAFAALQMQNHVLANHRLAGAYDKLKVRHQEFRATCAATHQKADLQSALLDDCH